MSDRQLSFTTGPLPTSVQVSGPDRLHPKAVNATFDGTGAAGAFLPCLIITGRTGLEVALIPAPQVAAGASAEVSWFPRVGGAAAAVSTAAREQLQTNVPLNIGSNFADFLPWDHLDGASLLNLTNPQQPKVKAAGVYGITTTINVDPMPAGASYYHQLSAGSPGFPVALATPGAATAAQSQPFATCTMVSELRVNEPLFAYVFNYAAVALNFYIYRAIVQRIS